jgi:hypothetical protein
MPWTAYSVKATLGDTPRAAPFLQWLVVRDALVMIAAGAPGASSKHLLED